METQHVGFLHPGAMGISLANASQNSGHAAYWVSAGRSQDTRARANKYNLIEVDTLQSLCDRCSVLVSVCPPHAAKAVADQVLRCSFKGLYVDVNAISIQRAKQICDSMRAGGVDFVDGGIVGGPAWTPNSTWLYLSGPLAHRISDCFKNGPLETEVIGKEIGKASALKMCFAANTKGTTALLCAVLAAAESLGVRKELEKQWSRNGSGYAQKTLAGIRHVTTKAWRFAGEMDEIAATFQAAGVPNGFHHAAGEIYQRLAKFKNADPSLLMTDIIGAVLKPDEK